MQPETLSSGEVTMRVIRLTRFAMACTLGLATALLLVDCAGRGWNFPSLRFMSETVVLAFVGGIAFEAAIAVAAVTCVWCVSSAARR